jgi:hypothetical protein
MRSPHHHTRPLPERTRVLSSNTPREAHSFTHSSAGDCSDSVLTRSRVRIHSWRGRRRTSDNNYRDFGGSPWGISLEPGKRRPCIYCQPPSQDLRKAVSAASMCVACVQPVFVGLADWVPGSL